MKFQPVETLCSAIAPSTADFVVAHQKRKSRIGGSSAASMTHSWATPPAVEVSMLLVMTKDAPSRGSRSDRHRVVPFGIPQRQAEHRPARHGTGRLAAGGAGDAAWAAENLVLAVWQQPRTAQSSAQPIASSRAVGGRSCWALGQVSLRASNRLQSVRPPCSALAPTMAEAATYRLLKSRIGRGSSAASMTPTGGNAARRHGGGSPWCWCRR